MLSRYPIHYALHHRLIFTNVFKINHHGCVAMLDVTEKSTKMLSIYAASNIM
jgi:hypothetical protein